MPRFKLGDRVKLLDLTLPPFRGVVTEVLVKRHVQQEYSYRVKWDDDHEETLDDEWDLEIDSGLHRMAKLIKARE